MGSLPVFEFLEYYGSQTLLHLVSSESISRPLSHLTMLVKPLVKLFHFYTYETLGEDPSIGDLRVYTWVLLYMYGSTIVTNILISLLLLDLPVVIPLPIYTI